MEEEYTTIRVSEETKERLEERGRMNMSYDDVLTTVLDKLDQMEENNDRC